MVAIDAGTSVRRWARSGAMALTGTPDRPLGPPAGLLDVLDRMAPPGADPLTVVVERAAVSGLRGRGRTSCGGASRLLRCGDGWLAVTLARPDDVAAVPAWLEVEADAVSVWDVVTHEVSSRTGSELVERARQLGLPVAELGAATDVPAMRSLDLGPAAAPRPAAGLLVVDLGSLWAGPLCGRLLHDAGAQVVKVESTSRPDGARRGPPAFFDLLNAGKRSVALDLTTPAGVADVRRLLGRADVVIETSRARALAHLGIDAASLVAEGGPQVWVSITGYGRDDDGVAFGDDAAVAGGLVVWDDGQPSFCADAAADPLSGLFAAHACIEALGAGRRVLLDVAMAGVAATGAGPTLSVPLGTVVEAPAHPPIPDRAAALGADTASVLAGLA